MTQDEVIEIAQMCRLIGMRPHLDGIYTEALVAFANLVAAKEREACAKVCLVIDEMDSFYGSQFAEAIRARGQT
jgi:hypothetical protein